MFSAFPKGAITDFVCDSPFSGLFSVLCTVLTVIKCMYTFVVEERR